MNEAELQDAVDSTLVIVFLMLSILSVKKVIIVLVIFYEFADILGPGSFYTSGLKLNSWRAASLQSLAPTSSNSHLLGSF